MLYGFNYCSVCRNNYTGDNREPPCETSIDGMCNIIADIPFYLLPKNTFAWDVYCDVRALSSPDSFGLPTIGKIDFYFTQTNLQLTEREHEDLLDKIGYINSYMRFLISKKKV